MRRYLERQWTKILAGRVSVQDFIFAKEVRLGTYKCEDLRKTDGLEQDLMT